MRIAFFADIHANLEALHACLGDARARGAERFVFLGDYVGCGPDPEAVVETVMTCVAQGAMAVRGNHDHAVADLREGMSDDAQTAIAWTRGQLGAAARANSTMRRLLGSVSGKVAAEAPCTVTVARTRGRETIQPT